MKRIGFILLIVSVIFIMASCGEDNTASSSDNNVAENNKSTNNDNVSNDENNVANDLNEDEEKEEAIVESEVLELGETGSFVDSDKSYEITPTEFSLVNKSENEDTQTSAYEHGVYFVVDLTVENTGDVDLDTIDFMDYANYYLMNDQQEGKINFLYPDRETDFQRVLDVERFEKDDNLPAGETMEGQVFFETTPSDEYDMVFGGITETNQNEVIWKLNADDATEATSDLANMEDVKDKLSMEETSAITYVEGMGEEDLLEVTPQSIDVVDEVKVDDQEYTPDKEDDKYVVIELEVENKGEKEIEEEIISGDIEHPVLLMNDNEINRATRIDDTLYTLENDESPIEPGETVERTLYFQAPEASAYDLQYGSVYQVLYENEEAIWHLEIED